MRQKPDIVAEERIRIEAAVVEELTGKSPLVFIREGKPDEILTLINEEPNIRLLV